MIYTITMACYRSAAFLENTVRETEEALAKLGIEDYELILINDGSPDETFAEITRIARTHPRILGLDLAKNMGQHNAILMGLREGSGEIFINLDDDLQTHPSQIGKLLEKLNEGHDVVYARYDHSSHSLKKRCTSWVHHQVIRWFLDKKDPWVATSFWAARRFVVEEMVTYCSEFTDIQATFVRVTKDVVNQPVAHFERCCGESGYTFKKSLKLWSATLNYTEKPALLLLKGGALFIGVSFGALLLGGILGAFWGHHSLYYLVCLLLLLLGLVAFVGGFLGLYASRILKVITAAPTGVKRTVVRSEDLPLKRRTS
ncbi:hypothetical protein ABB02_00571 [Clostridiaceae bacterium JG1575]|nr:hypothetical protein ABB02_00571 [Clostridiaceae bacterium JG1575]